MRASPIKWEKLHIKGHQDNHREFKTLTRNAQANVISDKLAKAELNRNNTPNETSQGDGHMWKLSCHGHRISGDTENRLRYHMQEIDIRNWWTIKLRVPSTSLDRIDWGVYEAYRLKTPKWLNTWSVKFGADILPTKRNQQRRGHSDNHKCPCCGESFENAVHIFQCKATEMTGTYNEAIDKISDYLYETTSRAIRVSIMDTIDAVRNANTPVLLSNDTEATAAFHQQSMGARALLNGLWLQDWISLQDQHYKKIHSRKSPRVWLVRLALLLQYAAHSMWRTRNEAIHKREESNFNTDRHKDLDDAITTIFNEIPNLRLLPPSEAAFFKRGAGRIKKYKIRRKELWVKDAKRIKEAFFDSLDATSDNFLDFFENATTR